MASKEDREKLFATLDEMQTDGLIEWEEAGQYIAISITPKGTRYDYILETLCDLSTGPYVEVSTS